MVIRQRFFALLSLASLLWLVLGLAFVWFTPHTTAVATSVDGSIDTATALGALQAGTLEMIQQAAVVLATGLPVLCLSAFVAWRCGVEGNARRRHDDLMRALQARRG